MVWDSCCFGASNCRFSGKRDSASLDTYVRCRAWADVGHKRLQQKPQRAPAAAGPLMVLSAPSVAAAHRCWWLKTSAQQGRADGAGWCQVPWGPYKHSVSPIGNTRNYMGRNMRCHRLDRRKPEKYFKNSILRAPLQSSPWWPRKLRSWCMILSHHASYKYVFWEVFVFHKPLV